MMGGRFHDPMHDPLCDGKSSIWVLSGGVHPLLDGHTYMQPSYFMCVCMTQVLGLLEEGENNRHIGSTKMNDQSSRSHTLFRMVSILS